MAEKVSNGIDGLHFRANDPLALASVIRRAAGTPGLWERLKSGIKPVYQIEESVKKHADLYERLIAEKGCNNGNEKAASMRSRRASWLPDGLLVTLHSGPTSGNDVPDENQRSFSGAR